MDEEISYLLIGGFPTRLEEYAASREIKHTLDKTGRDTSVIKFMLDEEDENRYEQFSGKALYEEVLDPALQKTDFSPYLSKIAEAAEEENVWAFGYCTGGTLLAAYQQQAHASDDLPLFDAAVVLDASTGITTDHQDITVNEYKSGDMVGIYDSQVPDQGTIQHIPHIKVHNTDHLWSHVPKGFGDIVHSAASIIAEHSERAEKSLEDIVIPYDELSFTPSDSLQRDDQYSNTSR